MANHRTMPLQVTVEKIELSTLLSLGDVVAAMEVDYDVSEAISSDTWDGLLDPEPGPVFLAWQSNKNGELRLLKIDDFLYRVINDLKRQPHTTAELIVSWADQLNVTQTAANNLPHVLDSLSDAVKQGLVNIERS